MPDVSGPFDTASFAQAAYYRDRGYLEPSGVSGIPAANAGAGGLGLTAVGFDLSMALGRAHVRGAYYERTGTAWTTTVPANTHATQARDDLIVLRRSLTAMTVVPARLQGTPAATPTDPALTLAEDGVWEEPLFRVRVPAASGTPLVITDLRRWIDPDTGEPILSGTATGGGRYVGQRRDHPSRGLERWNGTAWGLPTIRPIFQAYQNAATTGLAAGWRDLPLQAENYDSHDGHKSADLFAYVIPETGPYGLEGLVWFAADAANPYRSVRITVDGAVYANGTGMAGNYGTGIVSLLTGRKVWGLNAGAVIRLQGYSFNAWATHVDNVAGNASTLTIERLMGA